MIERKFIEDKIKEHKIKTYLKSVIDNAGFSKAEIEKTPVGMKIIIKTSKPGLVVGKSGDNIRTITDMLKNKFGLENPQLDIEEVREPDLDAQIVADRIVFQLKKFGKSRFKAIGFKNLQRMIDAGAVGAEVTISGRIPSAFHKTWRFKMGRLPKNGYIADYIVDRGFEEVQWNQGTVGVKVAILKPTVRNPDDFNLIKVKEEVKKNDNKKE